MDIYLLNVGIVFVWSWFAKMYGKEDHSLPTGYRPNAIIAIVPLVSLVIVAGLRYKVGTDYQTYMLLYELAGKYDSLAEIFGFGGAKASTDPGFTALLWLLNHITSDPQIMFVTVAAVTYLFIVKTLYIYGRPFELSMFLFLGMFYYYASFNGIRQYMVAGILFWAVKYVIGGNWVRYVITVLICSLFHSSALIMIPVYFIVRRKAWSPLMGCLTLLFLAGTFMYQKFLSVFIVMLENSSYGHYEEWLMKNSNGMNSIKIIVLLIPLVLAFCFREQLRKRWPEIDYIVNFCLIGFLFGVLATKDVIFARFNIYFGLYQLILVPYFVRIFEPKSNALFYIMILICYFLYSFMLMPFDSSVLPYRTIFER
ncbi:EpsG family protein [Bacillus sonorensis]|uniref:Transmembrane protein EpsG n=2 Tax=Bacillus sonorensis TaxID=119858 RepID=M5P1E6_9BACI|nr:MULTISPECIES: EpsG family protein [Bacillus]TWK79532.1 Transmembrane protein EpsG [Bacillus paralicheniformis]ASB87266.1 Transmembrane protein EpsG [Bacillus sonorensis]EME73253.1 transmembrane protein EpsG [Bacillus sonorensis L12]MBG9914246.1 membrane protein [Bacillus sonorensis]MCF7616512.1 EpsG family protein [Bacillus sonorensis]